MGVIIGCASPPIKVKSEVEVSVEGFVSSWIISDFSPSAEELDFVQKDKDKQKAKRINDCFIGEVLRFMIKYNNSLSY
tara:strand:+ start:142 stop:375 length:234 start_codon:yes stop_codon:yes gene_type:complete